MPLAVTATAFSVWVIVATIWSPEPADALPRVIKLVPLILLGCFALRLPHMVDVDGRRAARWMTNGTAVAVVLLLAAIGYAYGTGDALWGEFDQDPLTPLNSNAVVLALISWPLLIVFGPRKPFEAAALAVCTLITLCLSSSLAAFMVFLICSGVLVFRWMIGVRAGYAIAVVAAALIVLAPYIIQLTKVKEYLADHPVAYSDVTSSARHRLAMWSFAAEKIGEKPWLGWGMGASRHIPQEEYRLAPNMEIMPLHPHNLALQTRLELGLPGALILAGFVFAIFYRLATFTDDGWKSGVAMAAASAWLFVANVSYGMWQSWWIAMAFLLAILMKIAFAAGTRKAD
ncbi:MAG: O-antigen ligase family protein [Rhodospirillales bacterium]|nr:O-antigen ligase family protein [Rhodospirillales bacterium]MBO6786030.1 O-antigen ligase family protein [Rhodospirillales bacterium]